LDHAGKVIGDQRGQNAGNPIRLEGGAGDVEFFAGQVIAVKVEPGIPVDLQVKWIMRPNL
jgi:hypothetical protein